MKLQSSNPELSIRPDGAIFITVVALILIFIMAARTPLDSDMWWHLRAGEETWNSGRPMMVDTFSYTRYGEAWINHSWLSQVGLYLLFHNGGYLALGAGLAALATLSMGLVYLQMEGHPLLRSFVLVLAAVVAAKVWSPRPQLVSLVMFGLAGYILYLYKWEKRDKLWLVPVLFVLWSNLHGGYVLGLLLIGSMIFGEAFNHILGNEQDEVIPWTGVRRLILIGLVSGLVVVVNPNGLSVWLIPFQTVKVKVLQEFISEWSSPDFHQLSQQPFLWLLLGTFGAAGLSRKRLDATDFMNVAGFAYLGLVARRNFGPFAMVAAPVLTRHLWTVQESWSERVRSQSGDFQRRLEFKMSWPKTEPLPPKLSKAINTVIIVLLVLVAVLKVYFVTNPMLVDYYEERNFPVKAVAWIEKNQPAGHLFNTYNWGGFLIWDLPEYQVFVDGRTDLYNDEVLGDWLKVVNADDGWENILEDWKVHLLLLQPDMKINEHLETDGWRVLYSDQMAVIYGR